MRQIHYLYFKYEATETQKLKTSPNYMLITSRDGFKGRQLGSQGGHTLNCEILPPSCCHDASSVTKKHISQGNWIWFGNSGEASQSNGFKLR